MKKNIFEIFLNKVFNVPLWIKQVMFIKLSKEMEELGCDESLRKNQNGILSTYAPILTYKGETELSEKKCGLDNNIYNFLQCCSDGYSLIEISVNSFFTMEETAKYFVFCVDQNFIKKPELEEIYSMAEFISGKTQTNIEETEFVLRLKNESKKRLILDYNSLPTVKTEYANDSEKYEEEINNLKSENAKLKRKLQQLLTLVKKDA